MSLFLMAGIDDRNVEDPILTLARSVDRIHNEIELLKMSYDADLLWVIGELKGILASWGETEILNAVTKERVQHLVNALADKIKGS